MAKNIPTYIYLLSRRDRTQPFGIRSKQAIAAFSNREKAEKHMRTQRDGWQSIEPSTEYKIAFSGDVIDGFPEGLPHV